MPRSRNTKLTMFAFLLLGGSAVGGAVLYPAQQTVLLAVAYTFLFGVLLVGVLSNQQYVQTSFHEAVVGDLLRNEGAVVDSWDLQRTQVYIPRHSGPVPATLFIPKHLDFEIPPESALDSLFVTTGTLKQEGITFVPSGARLYEEFATATGPDLSDAPATLASELTDALVELFEIATQATTHIERNRDVVVCDIGLNAHENTPKINHPVVSFLGTGLAVGLDRPVVVDSQTTTGGRYDLVVEFRWIEAAPQVAR